MALSPDNQVIQKKRAAMFLKENRLLANRWASVKSKWGGNDPIPSYGAAWDFVMEDYLPIYEAKYEPLALHEAHFLAQWIGKKLEDS